MLNWCFTAILQWINRRKLMTEQNVSLEEQQVTAEPKERAIRVVKYKPDARVTILVDKNPKRPGSKAAAIWENYRDGMTVVEAIQAGVPREGLLYDSTHHFIKIEGFDPPPLPERKKREPKEPKEPKVRKEKKIKGQDEAPAQAA
jgi:hypothetical protein